MGKAAAIRLADLPPPPAGKTGWPWTEESSPLPERMPDGSEWPRISIVTPSFNQARFIEETLRSVLLQNYPNLEYLVLDGGSTDESAQIIRKYEAFLDYFVSEPDGGHAAAVNKGLSRATGSILAFINSDDFYLPGAFASAARQFHSDAPADLIYGSCLYVDQASREFIAHTANISSLDEILDETVWKANREIVQPEAFWRKSIFETTGDFNTTIHRTFCYEYWCRMLIAGATFRRIDTELSCFRFHPAQKTQREKDTSHEEYLAMVEPWLWDPAVALSPDRRRELQSEWLYNAKYIPAWAASAKRGDSTWRRWLGVALLCLRYPQLLSSREFKKRRQKRMGAAP